MKRKRKARTPRAEVIASAVEESVWDILTCGVSSWYGTLEGTIPDSMLRKLVKTTPHVLHYQIKSIERSFNGAGSREIFQVPVLGKVEVRTPSPWRDELQDYASAAVTWEMHETRAMVRSIIHTISILIANSPAKADVRYAKAAAEFAKANDAFEHHHKWFTGDVQCAVDLSLINAPALLAAAVREPKVKPKTPRSAGLPNADITRLFGA